jgi:hypothetical protein
MKRPDVGKITESAVIANALLAAATLTTNAWHTELGLPGIREGIRNNSPGGNLRSVNPHRGRHVVQVEEAAQGHVYPPGHPRRNRNRRHSTVKAMNVHTDVPDVPIPQDDEGFAL